MALSRARALSMGLKSGLYGGRRCGVAPTTSTSPHCCPFMAREVVHDDHVSGPELGHRDLRDIGPRTSRHWSTRPAPSARPCQSCAWPATSVVVLQWPCGKPIRNRSPFGQRPWLRIILVAVQVASIKTRRSGSRSIWPVEPVCVASGRRDGPARSPDPSCARRHTPASRAPTRGARPLRSPMARWLMNSANV